MTSPLCVASGTRLTKPEWMVNSLRPAKESRVSRKFLGDTLNDQCGSRRTGQSSQGGFSVAFGKKISAADHKYLSFISFSKFVEGMIRFSPQGISAAAFLPRNPIAIIAICRWGRTILWNVKYRSGIYLSAGVVEHKCLRYSFR
jgi:hypothetical protein